MQYFTTQLSNNQQTIHSLRASQYRKPSKRRRGEQRDGSSSPEPEVRDNSTSRGQSYVSHAPAEIAQLHVAGLLPEDEYEIPPSPFPHAPIKVAKERHGARNVQKEIAKPPTRLYAVNAASKGESINKQSEATSLRKTHLSVLSTVMHRCLLEGDYERAGRAWGMLLRTQVAGGHSVDPRNHGRWGIGAETLLRRKAAAAANQQHVSPPEQQTRSEDVFSKEGFELAREYYERLIIQYPNRKLSPHAVDERTFYPAMFSLWIFEVCEKSKRARRNAEDRDHRSRSRSRSIDSVLGNDPNSARAREDAIQIEELAKATEIAERLDQLIASPPFDKQASLLQLRGHVGLWISTILIGETAEDDDWDMDTTRGTNEATVSAGEQSIRLINAQRELLQAQNLLGRAEANGAVRQTATLTSVDIKLRELGTLLDKLRAPHED
jgi:hypothetical protein